MKIKPFVVGGIVVSFIMYGLFLYFFTSETLYATAPASAYIDGATPPHIKNWEMY